MINRAIKPITLQQASEQTELLLAATAALIIGCTLVFLVGFTPSDAVHSETHDLRHSMSFPCH